MSLTSLFSDIADAIRAKTGSQSSIVANEFPTAIASIPSGGGGTDTSDATAYADDIRAGMTAYARGSKLTGTAEDKTQMGIIMSSPSGYDDTAQVGRVLLTGQGIDNVSANTFVGTNQQYWQVDLNKKWLAMQLGLISSIYDTESDIIVNGESVLDIDGVGGEKPRDAEFSRDTPAYVLDTRKMYENILEHLTSAQSTTELKECDGNSEWLPAIIIGDEGDVHLEICFDPMASLGYYMAIRLVDGNSSTEIGMHMFIDSSASIQPSGNFDFGTGVQEYLQTIWNGYVTDTGTILCCRGNNETSFYNSIGQGQYFYVDCTQVWLCGADDSRIYVELGNNENYFFYTCDADNRV